MTTYKRLGDYIREVNVRNRDEEGCELVRAKKTSFHLPSGSRLDRRSSKTKSEIEYAKISIVQILHFGRFHSAIVNHHNTALTTNPLKNLSFAHIIR